MRGPEARRIRTLLAVLAERTRTLCDELSCMVAHIDHHNDRDNTCHQKDFVVSIREKLMLQSYVTKSVRQCCQTASNLAWAVGITDMNGFHQSVIGNLEFFKGESAYSGSLVDTLEIFQVIVCLCRTVISMGEFSSPKILIIKFKSILNKSMDKVSSLTESTMDKGNENNNHTVENISAMLQALPSYLYKYYLRRRIWKVSDKILEMCIYRVFTVYTTAIEKWIETHNSRANDPFRRMVKDTNGKIAHHILTFIHLNNDESRDKILAYLMILQEDIKLKHAENEYQRFENNVFHNYEINDSVQRVADLFGTSLRLFESQERVNTVVSQQRRKAMQECVLTHPDVTLKK